VALHAINKTTTKHTMHCRQTCVVPSTNGLFGSSLPEQSTSDSHVQSSAPTATKSEANVMHAAARPCSLMSSARTCAPQLRGMQSVPRRSVDHANTLSPTQHAAVPLEQDPTHDPRTSDRRWPSALLSRPRLACQQRKACGQERVFGEPPCTARN
jgi:hypothetical protein